MKYNKNLQLYQSSLKFSSNQRYFFDLKTGDNKTCHILHAIFCSDAEMYFFCVKRAAESQRTSPKQSDLSAWFYAINCESLHLFWLRDDKKFLGSQRCKKVNETAHYTLDFLEIVKPMGCVLQQNITEF